MHLGELIETFYRKGELGAGENLRPALDILMTKIGVSDDAQDTMSEIELVERIFDACQFAVHYYVLRDLIWYSFALPESIKWNQGNKEIKIEILDNTIFRQLACETLIFFMNSRNTPKLGANKLELLQGTGHFDTGNPSVMSALHLIEQEAEWKISNFFSAISPDCEIDLGDGYTYKEFLAVYNTLLVYSLYERYYSMANNLSSVITYNENELAEIMVSNADISMGICVKILRNIAASSRGTFVYFKRTNKYYLLPFSFSLKDGIVAILKYHGQKNSAYFSGKFGDFLGNSLVNQVSSCFSIFKNFRVKTDVKLHSFGKELPDIDIVALSYEPSLGFHFFICEVKNNLTASWAKEYLRSTGEKGFIPKAIEQINRLQGFIKSKAGQEFLYKMAITEFAHLDLKKLFPTGLMVVVDYLIITSQSIGMFFSKSDVAIINDSLILELIKKSDGDVNYIQHFIRHLDEIIDSCYSLSPAVLTIGDMKISYMEPKLESLMVFEPNEYISTGQLEELEKTAMDGNYSFINHLFDKPNKEEKQRE